MFDSFVIFSQVVSLSSQLLRGIKGRGGLNQVYGNVSLVKAKKLTFPEYLVSA